MKSIIVQNVSNILIKDNIKNRLVFYCMSDLGDKWNDYNTIVFTIKSYFQISFCNQNLQIIELDLSPCLQTYTYKYRNNFRNLNISFNKLISRKRKEL